MLATPFFRTCRLKHAKHISAGDIEPDENRKRTSQTGPTLYISRVLAHSGWCRASHQIEDINVFSLKFGTNGETTWKIAKYCPVLFWRWPETTQVKDVPATPFPIIYRLYNYQKPPESERYTIPVRRPPQASQVPGCKCRVYECP